MKDVQIIIIALVAIGIALFTVSYVNSLQTRKRLIKQRLSQLKRNVSELVELAGALEALLGNVAIEKIVIEETIDKLKGMQQLSPDNMSIELNIESLIKRLEEISSAGYQANLYRVFDSDAQIARARHHLTEAGRIVRKRQSAGHIELARMTLHIEELAWAHMMVQVVSLVAQGHKAFTRGDVLRAFSYYKKAQENVMRTTLPDDRRHQLIKELGEMQSNSRRALSPDLMPETEFNPPNTPPPQ